MVMSHKELLEEREILLALLHEAVECLVWMPPDRNHEGYPVAEERVSKVLRRYDEYLGEVS